jgi:hypothetical protein
LSDFKTCPHCGRPSARDVKGRPMKLCGSGDCKRAAARDRSRAFRARQKAAAEPVAPSRTRTPKATAYRPDMPSSAGPVLAPWHRTYKTVADMFGDQLLTGGLDGTVTTKVQNEWGSPLDEQGS